MTTDNPEELRNQLDLLKRRIDERAKQLRSGGLFSEAHHAALRDIESRERALRDRVRAATRTGSEWDIIRTEFQRDYDSLFDNIVRLEQSIDARFDVGAPHKGGPPSHST